MGLCASRRAVSLEEFYELDTPAVLLGQGACSKVFRARSRATGALVAVKRLDKAHQQLIDDDPVQWEREVTLLRRCAAHPNVVALHDVLETPEFVYIIMELAEGGELFQALIDEGAYSEWDARRYIRDVLEALGFLHDLGIAHRDVKPENLLLTSPSPKRANIKLADFGLAALVDESSLLTNGRMTWAYCAPEVFKTSTSDPPTAPVDSDENALPQPARHSGVGVKSDIWSVGVVLYVLLSGIHPFDPDGRQTRDQMINNIRLGQFSMTGLRWDAISSEAKSLILALLSGDPDQRPTAVDALSHEWFASTRTSRESLAVSLSDTEGLAQYCHMMRRKFRSSVLAAVAADTFRRSLHKSRQSGSVANDQVVAPVEETQTLGKDDGGAVSPCPSSPSSASAEVVALPDSKEVAPKQPTRTQSVLSHILQTARLEVYGTDVEDISVNV